MDTKTPPIPLKPPEKPQLKKAERVVVDVSLPPLTPHPTHRSKNKSHGASWSQEPPCAPQYQDHRKRKPYRVLHIGATPLMHACQQGDRARVLRLLKDQEETITYRDRTLRNALHYCMDAGTGGAVAAAAPELVNAPDAEGHTPLHLAVIAGDTQLVAVLLANGADVNAKDLEGHSVLHWATVCGEVECVRLVLAAGAQPSTPDLRGGSPLHYAAQCCGAAATAELAVPKKVGLTILQTLLEYGADVNAKDEDGRQPILWAASAGSVEAVLALARAGGSVAAGTSDKDGLTALHCAASRGHARCVEALVNLCGSHPDHVDDNGCSALHYAATLGHADATALILKLGADPNRQDRKGRTPALCAAAKGQLETLKILSQHGASLHARTVRGTGIGHEAVASGRIELIKWLAKRRPSTLDVATHDGKTPLHVAALHGHLDACKVLLDHGAKINAVLRTSKGNSMTPLDAALYKGHRDCAKLIQMHGGATAQQLRTHKTTPSKVFTAKFRVKRTDSSTDSSPRRQGHNRPELYYEERWIERRTRRKGNARKLVRQGSRSFSEEEVRLSKISSRKDERRARSESARFENDVDGRNPRRKRRKSTKRKHEYSDSSTESDSCDYSYDKGDEGKANARQHAKKRQEKDKSKGIEDNSRKEDDDERSVSDDSLEVIVVKKSLEKKCEKVVSGRRSKTPRECTKETKVTKTHTRSSTKTSRSGRSKASDDDPSAADRSDKSPRKEEEPTRRFADEDEDDEERMEPQYQQDATDSTSQETVERVVVTAMVHKNQAPDTPKSTLETAREANLDGGSKERAMDTEKTKGTSRDIDASDENEILSRKTDMKDVEERPPQTTQESPGKIQDKDKKAVTTISSGAEDARKEETTDDKVQGRLETLESVTSGDNVLHETHEAAEKKTLDKSEDLTKDEESSPSVGRVDQRSVISEGQKVSTTEIGELSTSRESELDGESKDARVPSEEKSATERVSVKAVAEQSSESADKNEAKENGDFEHSEKIQEDRKQKAQTSSSVTGRPIDDKDESASIVNAEETFTPERTDSPHKKSDYSSSSSPKTSRSVKTRHSRPSTGRNARARRSSSKASTMKHLFERSEERLPHQRAIVAVIDSPEWDEDEAVEKEIRDALGEDMEQDTEHEEDNEIGVMRVLPSTSEEETFSTALGGVSTTSRTDFLPQVQSTTSSRLVAINPEEGRRLWRKQRRDSGGKDSGIEPSPRVSRIPRRRNIKCCPNTAKQQALNMETITRDVQISLRRYHLERKIFFQLMELKRLQIRHGRANEHVLVKRQVEAFHRSGMSGPTLGVAKYDRPFTFRQFEAFLYEQLRKLQGRPTTPDFCTEAKQCTQKTHRCHHATSAYTSIPVYTYLGGGVPDRVDHLPKIEGRGKGQMTVEVTHGEEKQVIALPTEKLDRTKRYFVTFTVRGETQDTEKPRSSCTVRRNAQSV